MIACVAECVRMYNNIITFISRFPVKPRVMLMKTFLKSSDKSTEYFSELEKRAMGSREVIKQPSVTEPEQQCSHWGWQELSVRDGKAISDGVSQGRWSHKPASKGKKIQLFRFL